jgi:hypothetical protein
MKSRVITLGVLTILLVLICIYGCESARTNTTEVENHLHLVPKRDCQYIVLFSSSGMAITHAGDCTNPIHINK